MLFVEDLARFLQGAGGLVEQTSAYLDHHSALDYMAMTRASAVTMAHQVKIPLHDIARAIIANSAGVCLLYTSDAADDRYRVDLGGRRIIKKI